jgi:hypothetical protein
MDDLVAFLSTGVHPVEATLRPQPTAVELESRIRLGYVHITFVDTRGGTEVGVQLDPAATNVADADFARGTGRVRIVGSLSLNFVPVRCIADIDLATLKGSGHLEITNAV